MIPVDALNSTCFLCKRVTQVTEEHVFPQWLQSDFNLRNQFMTLRNGTKFKYSKLTIPCCKECNNIHLSIIENAISIAVRRQDIDYLKHNPDLTFIWLYKIMYGLHYKELFLRADITNPSSQPIVKQNEILDKMSYSIFPKFARGEIIFEGFHPYSLFVFEILDSFPEHYFYIDEPYKMYSLIVLGNIGIVCSFQCDGYIESDVNKYLGLEKLGKLTMSQFGDFSAFILNLKSRMAMLPNYICKQKNDKIIFTIQNHNLPWLYSEFSPHQQIETTRQFFHHFFEGCIDNSENGTPTIKYSSPFIYF